MPVSEVKNLADTEPVVGRIINGKARAYPLRILTWHEIVNDGLGSVPVTVTYCPLCNSAIIFDRRLDGKVLDFGTTGKLRFSDLEVPRARFLLFVDDHDVHCQSCLGNLLNSELSGFVICRCSIEGFVNGEGLKRCFGLAIQQINCSLSEGVDRLEYAAGEYKGVRIEGAILAPKGSRALVLLASGIEATQSLVTEQFSDVGQNGVNINP